MCRQSVSCYLEPMLRAHDIAVILGIWSGACAGPDHGGEDASVLDGAAAADGSSDAAPAFTFDIDILDEAPDGEVEIVIDGETVPRVPNPSDPSRTVLRFSRSYSSFEGFVLAPYLHVVTRVDGREVFSQDISDICLGVCLDGCASISPVLREAVSIVLEANGSFTFGSGCVSCEGASEARYRCP